MKMKTIAAFIIGGELYYTDAYIPYRGVKPVPQERLKISENSLAIDSMIILEDGTYLLRKEFFEQTRSRLDQQSPINLH